MTSSLVSTARVLVAALDGNYPLPDAIAAFRHALDDHEQRDGFAETCWSIDDVRRLRPAWSDSVAREFLARRGGLIQDAMVEAGWIAIEALLDEDATEVP